MITKKAWKKRGSVGKRKKAEKGEMKFVQVYIGHGRVWKNLYVIFSPRGCWVAYRVRNFRPLLSCRFFHLMGYFWLDSLYRKGRVKGQDISGKTPRTDQVQSGTEFLVLDGKWHYLSGSVHVRAALDWMKTRIQKTRVPNFLKTSDWEHQPWFHFGLSYWLSKITGNLLFRSKAVPALFDESNIGIVNFWISQVRLGSNGESNKM